MADDGVNLMYDPGEHDVKLQKSFHSTCKELRTLTLANIEHYQRGKSSIYARYYASFRILFERVQSIEVVVDGLFPELARFDFSPDVHANGYRSFVSLIERCCIHLLQLCRHINTNKLSVLFRASHYCCELEAYVEALGQLWACLHYLEKLMSFSTDGDLFVTDDKNLADNLFLEVEMLNVDCFYGRCLGFQFYDSIQKILQGVMVAMATFSECYQETSQVFQLASSLLNSGKYVVDQDLRAKQVVNVTRTADIQFCKAFWSIPDSHVLHQLRSFTFPYVEVSQVISLDAGNFELPLVDGSDTVVITPPCAHTGPGPVNTRLISFTAREGQQMEKESPQRRFKTTTTGKKGKRDPPSPGLLFHCHGGGFVAQSSQSHENYLRKWAQQLNMPIFSVDYSLAPDLPFPRALEECFYAYSWALKNPEKLGWTGERICFAGDSAGANLAISTAMRAVSYGIRIPDGITVVYPVVLIQYRPSPSRLLSMIDPLLPVGILTRCLAAYAGIADKLASALTEPIFCNPSNVEKWEIIGSDNEESPSSSNQNLDYIGDVEKARLSLIKQAAELSGESEGQPNGPHSAVNDKQGSDWSNGISRNIGGNKSETKSTVPTSSTSVSGSSSEEFYPCDSIDKVNLNFTSSEESIKRDAPLSTEFNVDDLEDSYDGSHAGSDDMEFACVKDVCSQAADPVVENCVDTNAVAMETSGNSDSESSTENTEFYSVENSVSDSFAASDGEVSPLSECPPEGALPQSYMEDANTHEIKSEKICFPKIKSERVCSPEIESEKTHSIGEPAETFDSTNGVEAGIKLSDSTSADDNDMTLTVGMATCEGQAVDFNSALCRSIDDMDDEEVGETEGACGVDLLKLHVTDNDCKSHSLRRLSSASNVSCQSIEEEIPSQWKYFTNTGQMEDVPQRKCLHLEQAQLDKQPMPGKSDNSPAVIQSDSYPSSESYDQPGDTVSSIGTKIPRSNTAPESMSRSFSIPAKLSELQRSDCRPRLPETINLRKARQRQTQSESVSPESPLSDNDSPTSSNFTGLVLKDITGLKTFTPKLFSVQRKITHSPIQLFRQLPIVKNHYMSPILAPDELIKGLPPVHIVASQFDPLLDDAVMFAKKLRLLGNSVDLTVMEGLPHGFLNFSDTSPEAKHAANVCLSKIKSVLQPE